jgi:hypothetical protein
VSQADYNHCHKPAIYPVRDEGCRVVTDQDSGIRHQPIKNRKQQQPDFTHDLHTQSQRRRPASAGRAAAIGGQPAATRALLPLALARGCPLLP